MPEETLLTSSKQQPSKQQASNQQTSKLLVCRGGLGEAPYNTPRHSRKRCRKGAVELGYSGKTGHFGKKTVFDHRCAVFRRSQPLQTWGKSEGDQPIEPLVGTFGPQRKSLENHLTQQFSIVW